MITIARLRPALVGVLAAALTLTACGGDSDVAAPAETPASTADSALPAAEGAVEYPLTLTTWAGETVLEERPERIAVIGFSTNIDALQALDVVPVYTVADDTAWEWRDQDWYSEIETVDTATRRDPINYEVIATTAPDLIVATNFVADSTEFDLLAEIAPVLEIEEQTDGQEIDWRETLQLVGDTLDLGEAAADVVAEADAAIAGTAAAHPQFAGKTVTIATDYSTGMEYYTTTGGTAEGVVTELGFAPNPLAEQFGADVKVSDERLNELDADALLVFYVDADTQATREASPVFQAIPAVAGGRYVGVNGDESGANATWVMRRGASALSLPWAVDQLATWYSSVLPAS